MYIYIIIYIYAYSLDENSLLAISVILFARLFSSEVPSPIAQFIGYSWRRRWASRSLAHIFWYQPAGDKIIGLKWWTKFE